MEFLIFDIEGYSKVYQTSKCTNYYCKNAALLTYKSRFQNNLMGINCKITDKRVVYIYIHLILLLITQL